MNLILIILLVHYTLMMIFKPKITTLNCGIFAWAGKNPKRFNKPNFDILGMWNEERGTHSCGVAIDGEIKIGIDGNKVYRDFMANNKLILPKKYPVIIGHTRHSTYGKHNIDNAHPFGFGNHEEGFKFIGVHNGTLIDYKELAKEFNLKVEVTKRFEKSTTTRTKIDSEVLLEAIYKTKSFKPLEKYNGAAALVFTNTEEPNVIYCYHGASKKYNSDPNNSKQHIERPLYYYRQNKNSLYISSIEESLFSIGGTEKNVVSFDVNTVYKITDGDIDNAEKIVIDRTGRYNTSIGYGNSNYKTYDSYDDIYDNPYRNLKNNINTPLLPQNNSTSKVGDNKFNIYNEKADGRDKSGKIYFKKLRYYNNDTKLNGCYTYIPEFGFYYLGVDLQKSINTSLLLLGKMFLDNEFITDKKDEMNPKTFIPFKKNNDIPLFYFYEGIRLKSRLDYSAILDLKNNNKSFDWIALSEAAAHPICEDIHYKASNSQAIMLDGVLVTDNVCPLGSDFIYNIVDGNCVNITPIKNKKDKVDLKHIQTTLFNKDTLSEVVDILEGSEREFINNEKKNKLITNDILEEEINTIFFTPFSQFQEDLKTLERYSHLKRAKDAMSILIDFIEESKCLIQLENKE